MCCSQLKLFFPSLQEALIFLSGPCPLSASEHAKTQLTLAPAPGHSPSDACNSKRTRRKQLWTAGKGPTFGFRGSCQGSRPPTQDLPEASALLRAPGKASRHHAPLTCSAASCSVAVHLDSILEHPFFSTSAASAVTSSGGGLHAATWCLWSPAAASKTGGGPRVGGKTLPVPKEAGNS